VSNALKFSTSLQTEALNVGNYWIGTGDVAKGPTNITSYWSSILPPAGGYTVYLGGETGGYPAAFCPANDAELISLTNRIAGTNYSTAAECLAYYATQPNRAAVNKNYPPIVTNGLSLLLDASYDPSYPTTGSTWYDLSGNDYNGTIYNGPAYNSNGYLDFDGTDDWVLIGGLALSTSAYTKVAWFYPDGASANIISGGSDGQHAFWMAGSSTTLYAGHNGAWQTVGYSPGNMVGRWWFGAVSFNTSTGWNLYLNDQLVDTDSNTTTFTGGTTVRISAYDNASNLFNGKIATAQVYNRVLSGSEILQNYYQAPIVTDGLVFMSDAANLVSFESGSTTTYSLVNNYTGTLTNGTTYSSNAGGVFVFDGTNDYIEMPYNSYWDSNVFGTATNFTISCWAKPNLFMNWDTLITKNIQGWYSSPEGASIWTDANGFQGVFSSGVLSNPAGSTVILSYATTNTQKWYHVCFTGDGTTLRLYVDGIQRATDLVASRTVPVVTASVGPSFGLRDYWNGQMTGMMFYTRGITAQEVWQNFNSQRSRFGV
jgi:hypothetical protein